MNIRTGNLINKKFTQYLIPTIFMSMALSLGVIVDGIICANFIGTDALAAINLCTPIILAFSAIYSILGVGGSTLASHAMGRRDSKKADLCFSISMLMLVIAGIVVTVFGIIFMDVMVNFAVSGGALSALVNEYVSVYIYGSVIFFVVPGLAYFVRADGNPTLSAVILIVANVVNLVCDIVYIKFFHLGIRGAALASLTGYFVSVFIAIFYFVSKGRTLHFTRFTFSNLLMLKEMVLVGLPSALNSILMFVKITVVNKIALQYLGSSGATIVAVCNNCLSFAAIFIGASAQTMLPIMAVLRGEEDQNGMHFAVKRTLKVVSGASIIMLILFEVFPAQVAGVFGVTETGLLGMAVLAVRIFGLSLPLYGINYILMCYYQATEHKKLATFVTVEQGALFIIPLVFLLSAVFQEQGLGIWLSFVIAEVCTLVVTVLIAAYTAGKTKSKGIFLFQDKDNVTELDLSIPAKVESAVGLSEQVIQFCKQHQVEDKVANAAGVAIEEMTVNTIEYGYKNKPDNYIDINIKVLEEEVLIRIRDNGILFNPMEFEVENTQKVMVHGIEVVRKIAKSIEYARILGMNNLIIRI